MTSPSDRESLPLLVLLDPSLLAHTCTFLPGLPQRFQEIHDAFESYTAQPSSHASSLWMAVMRRYELRLVQKLFFMKAQPEYANETLVQNVDVPVCAAMFGRVDVLKWLEDKTNTDEWSDSLLSVAMSAKEYDVASWLLSHHPQTCVDKMSVSMLEALKTENYELFKMMASSQPNALDDKVLSLVTSSCSIEMVLFIHNLGVCWTASAMDCAAREGRLEVVELLHQYHSTRSTVDTSDSSALHEDEIGYESKACTTNAMDWAAAHGHIDVVRFLHENRTEGCTQNGIDGAAKRGNWDVVRFLIVSRTEGCTGNALADAAEADQLDIVLSLHQTFGVTTTKTKHQLITKAYHQERIDIARYLRDTECVPFSNRELCSAVADGDLGLVELLHGNHAERSTEEAITIAGAEGNIEMIDYLLRHRQARVSQSTFDNAVRTNRIALIKRLYDKFGFTTSCMPFAFHWGQDGLIQYLHEVVGAPLPEDALEIAASQGIVELAHYIWEKRGGDVARAIERAEERGHGDVVRLLRELEPSKKLSGLTL